MRSRILGKVPKIEHPKIEDPKIEDPEIEGPEIEDPEMEDPEMEDPETEDPEIEDLFFFILSTSDRGSLPEIHEMEDRIVTEDP